MKIEFKKIPQTKKDFSTSFASVKLEGNFCKITPSLVEVTSTISGTTLVDCARCGKSTSLKLDGRFDFLLSDGIFKKDSEDLVIEIEDGVIDFDEIIKSEIASLQSDYHFCEECSNEDKLFEQEY